MHSHLHRLLQLSVLEQGLVQCVHERYCCMDEHVLQLHDVRAYRLYCQTRDGKTSTAQELEDIATHLPCCNGGFEWLQEMPRAYSLPDVSKAL